MVFFNLSTNQSVPEMRKSALVFAGGNPVLYQVMKEELARRSFTQLFSHPSEHYSVWMAKNILIDVWFLDQPSYSPIRKYWFWWELIDWFDRHHFADLRHYSDIHLLVTTVMIHQRWLKDFGSFRRELDQRAHVSLLGRWTPDSENGPDYFQGYKRFCKRNRGTKTLFVDDKLLRTTNSFLELLVNNILQPETGGYGVTRQLMMMPLPAKPKYSTIWDSRELLEDFDFDNDHSKKVTIWKSRDANEKEVLIREDAEGKCIANQWLVFTRSDQSRAHVRERLEALSSEFDFLVEFAVVQSPTNATVDFFRVTFWILEEDPAILTWNYTWLFKEVKEKVETIDGVTDCQRNILFCRQEK